jgi:hypothetical protein
MLRGDHVVGDDRQEHADNHNLLEPFVRDYVAPTGGAGATPLRTLWVGATAFPLLAVGDYTYVVIDGAIVVFRALGSVLPAVNPPTGDWEALTPPIPSPYVWDGATAYAAGDLVLVIVDDIYVVVYRALADSIASEPPSAAWQALASSRAAAFPAVRQAVISWPMGGAQYTLGYGEALQGGISDGGVAYVNDYLLNGASQSAHVFVTLAPNSRLVTRVRLTVIKLGIDGAATDLRATIEQDPDNPIDVDTAHVIWAAPTSAVHASMEAVPDGINFLETGYYGVSLEVVWSG